MCVNCTSRIFLVNETTVSIEVLETVGDNNKKLSTCELLDISGVSGMIREAVGKQRDTSV